jgi:hypothetical protein
LTPAALPSAFSLNLVTKQVMKGLVYLYAYGHFQPAALKPNPPFSEVSLKADKIPRPKQTVYIALF